MSNSGTLNLLGGTVSSPETDAVYNSGTLNVSGGTIASSASQAVYNIGTLNVSSGSVTSMGSYVIDSNTPGSVSVTGGSITGGDCGIYFRSTGTLSMTGGTVTGETTGIWAITDESTINITGGTVTGTSGCGIYATKANMTVTIGSSTATLSTTGSPKIVGGTYGVNRFNSSYTFDFSNGIIIGKTKSYYGTATVTRENYKTKTDYNSTDSQYETYLVKRPADNATADSSVSIATDYGTIDVIWLSGTSYSPTTIPNTPANNLGDMTKVTWTYDESTETWSEDDTAGSTWYNYTAGTDKTDNNSSMWANAKNSDGSYFVWIPRYAYRITYYESQDAWINGEDPTGYYDGYGMWSASTGELKYELDTGIKTVDYNGDKYIVHPAFMGVGSEDLGGGFGTETTDTGGGIKGFWVAKYEMSMEKYGSAYTPTSEDDGNVSIFMSKTIKAVSKPNVSSWRYINVSMSYNNGYYYDRDKESHLMKNSEWGAVAYLTHSQYGRNGYEIDVNNSKNHITGSGGGSPTASISGSSYFSYKTVIGAKASTTGNIYGIYDMSGGMSEHVAAWNSKGTDLSTYGYAFADGSTTKYATRYTNNEYTNTGRAVVQNFSMIGDAMKEVHMSSESHSWFGVTCAAGLREQPFMQRGGNANGHSGVFYAMCNTGTDEGYRVTLCP